MSATQKRPVVSDDGAKAERERIRWPKAALLDWDGCIAFEGKVDPVAAKFMAEFDGKLAIVSNNSTELPASFIGRLRPFGVQMEPASVILAGVEAIRRAREIGARRVMMIGNSTMKAFARNQGLNLVRDDAELVILLRDPRFTYARLERAANALRSGARLIVSNPDLTHPGQQGRLIPETGALLAALTACFETADCDMEVIGKPGPRLFQRACGVLGVQAAEAVMIGDNQATDIAGAEAFGLRSILVGPHSGVGFKDLCGRPASMGTAAGLRSV